MDQDTLKLRFSLKVLSGIEKPSACNLAEFSQKYYETAKKYIDMGVTRLGTSSGVELMTTGEAVEGQY